jgi:2-oxoglutarate dehydrogenase E1 component
MFYGSAANRWNVDLIEDYYKRWQHDPTSVPESWRSFFDGYELGGSSAVTIQRVSESQAQAQAHIARLIDGYRRLGHFLARLDPLSAARKDLELLNLSEFGFTNLDLSQEFATGNLVGLSHGSLNEILGWLRETYCRTIGVEYMHIQDTHIRRWLQERMEPVRNRPDLARRRKLRILMKLHYAVLFERFLHTRYPGQKRFSLEGAETLIPILDVIVEKGPDLGVREIVLGMTHRGRLNVLANILQKPYELIFAEFEGIVLPDSVAGDGDVKYHLGFSCDYVTAKGGRVHLSLTPNPSHLEAVGPVVEGRVRAKQRQYHDKARQMGLPLLVHGDAAFAGQGIVVETLNLSQLNGYRTGGTVHLIINNQIGFTTAPSDGRSTTYCTDAAKMLEVPIFHVNGEDPEACVYIAELALEFRQTFHKDVVIDMFCYRRHGHNEGDEPTFTQPLMYRNIQDRPSVQEVYTEQLIIRGDLKVEEAEAIADAFQTKAQRALDEVKAEKKLPHPAGFSGRWQGLRSQYSHQPVDTKVELRTLRFILERLAQGQPDFHIHPKIDRLFKGRLSLFDEKQIVDWATAEMLAFGSLLLEGQAVRLSGQDSGRGTFSQRHAAVYDTETGKVAIPLNSLRKAQADFTVYDSLLSEAAVLAFEYGYAMDEPESLVLWEAQFGDFANGAQVIIDQFIAAGESKWQRGNGVVLLLPHGYEGQGPEHSSARIERFLQLCAEDNIQVVNPTTPAQYFHLLRRQLKRNFRKPLVVMTPKSLLRHKAVQSPIAALTSDSFREVLNDPLCLSSDTPALRASGDGRQELQLEKVRRMLLCTGKVFYDLLEHRAAVGRHDVALVRLEQLYPLPERQLLEIVKPYRHVEEWVWVQEESQNMGAWSFIEPRLRAVLDRSIEYVGRDASASPATGSLKIHRNEQKELVEAALGGVVPHVIHSTGQLLAEARRV